MLEIIKSSEYIKNNKVTKMFIEEFNLTEEEIKLIETAYNYQHTEKGYDAYYKITILRYNCDNFNHIMSYYIEDDYDYINYFENRLNNENISLRTIVKV